MPPKTTKTKTSPKNKSSRQTRGTIALPPRRAISSAKEELFAKAFRSIPHPIGITELESGRCLEVNDACLELFGFRRDEVVGHTTLTWGIWSDPLERGTLIDRFHSEGSVQNFEVSLRVKNGDLRQFLLTTDLILLKGKQCLVTIGNDITERKRVEEALRRSEERWQLAETGTTDGIWDWDVTGHTVFLSARWKQLRGYREEEIGVDETEWSSRIHPEDFSRVMATVQSYFNKKLPTFHCEYRTRRKDGTYFWISDRGIAVWDAQGRVVRMVGSETDITERKRAEEELYRLNETLEQRVTERTVALQENQLILQEQRQELQRLTEQLFMAQESERQRIARDLHDDFSQRMAAVVLDLATLERRPPVFQELIPTAIKPMREEVERLANDLHDLAYKLHPSTLNHLGLQPAIEDFIHRAIERTGLRITLNAKDLPGSIPREWSTCLFRVFQECLQNVVKHAKATEVVVKLSGSSKGIGLSVIDNGKGFDQRDKGGQQKGLGLISMQERLRLLNGILNIHSRPTDGTKVCAWIPCRERKS